MRKLVALARRGAGPVAVALLLCGCQLIKGPERPLPLPDGVIPEQVIDADNPGESVTPLRPEELARVGKLMQAERKKRVEEQQEKNPKADPPKRYNILALSGGAVYGAYSAGVLCGWSLSGLPAAKGGRPEFDVVTGISTGALIAPFAFLGPKYDEQLRKEYTTTRTEDIYVKQRTLRNIFAQSFVDNSPFQERVQRELSDAVLREIAAEHAKGRRLFVGTTNIDTKRIVLWDIGAIATRGTPDADALVRQVVIASASIPGFFPPVEIDVTIDGRPYKELHVDGAISRSLFFRPPYFPPDQREAVGPDTLADSNLYVMVAGKINPAPSAVRLRTLPLALDSTNLILYNNTRGDLYRMYTYCLLTGMNLRVNAIPDDADVTTKGTEFDPVEMTKLFEMGFKDGRLGDITRKVPRTDADGKVVETEETRDGTAWRDVPPGLKGGEKQGLRSGRNLKVIPKDDPGQGSPRGPEPDKGPPRTPGPTPLVSLPLLRRE